MPCCFAPSKTLATGRIVSPLANCANPGELITAGSTPTNLRFDLCPVANAVAAGAESVRADSAE
ncbi:hypothetical protein D3C79_976140 [compost metagenome]